MGLCGKAISPVKRFLGRVGRVTERGVRGKGGACDFELRRH